MRGPVGRLELGRHLARRLLPLTVGIGILISAGLPATYFLLGYSALGREATMYAENLSAKFRALALEASWVRR
jgi:hypothetical protein